MTESPVQLVSEDDLRARFNAGKYWQRARAGELRQVLRRNGHPTTDQSGEPFCTRSQVLAYFDPQGLCVAVVRQYLRPDGTIGASGQPDPKLVVEAGVMYRLPSRAGRGV